MILQHSNKAHPPRNFSTTNKITNKKKEKSRTHLLGRDEGEELALGLVLVLGRRRRRLVILLAAAGGEAVLPELLPHELVIDERGAPEVGEHQPRDEQKLQLVPNRDPEENPIG